MAPQSPLKDLPLRLPGQSLDEEINQWQNEGIINYFIAASSFLMLAFMEWFGYLTHALVSLSYFPYVPPWQSQAWSGA